MNKVFATMFVGTVLLLGGLTAGVAASDGDHGGGHTPVTLCHKPGTNAEHTIVVDDDSVVQAHLAHGDTLGPCHDDTTPTETTPTETTPTDTVPTETTPTTPTPIPPPAHNCTFVGADKDGGKDKFGGTNDDCAPAPDPPVTVPKTETSRAVAPTQAQTPLVSTVTVTPFKTPKAKPQPKRKPAATPKPDKPKVTKRAPARKKCPPNTRLFQGKCHPVVMGNG